MEVKDCACTIPMPGYYFKPTDQELCYYLFQKLSKMPLSCCKHMISEFDVYSGSPWDIFHDDDPHWIVVSSSSEDSKKKKGKIMNEEVKTTTKKTIYVFTMLNKPQGASRAARIAGCGTWTDQNCFRVTNDRGKVVGFNRALTFYRQNEGGGITKRKNSDDEHGSWTMHEYYLSETDNYVLCKITKKVVNGKKQCPINTSDVAPIAKRDLEHQNIFCNQQQVGSNYLNNNQIQMPYMGCNSHYQEEFKNLSIPKFNVHGHRSSYTFVANAGMVHRMVSVDKQMQYLGDGNYHVEHDQVHNIHNHQQSFNAEPAASSLDSIPRGYWDNKYGQSQYGGSYHEQSNIPVLVNTKPSFEAESEAISLMSDDDINEILAFAYGDVSDTNVAHDDIPIEEDPKVSFNVDMLRDQLVAPEIPVFPSDQESCNYIEDDRRCCTQPTITQHI